MITRLFITLLILSIPMADAEEQAVEYLYKPALADRQELLLDRILVHARNGEYGHALTLSQSLLEETDSFRLDSPSVFGQVLVNHGIIQSAAGEYDLGLPLVDSGLAHMERTTNPFSKSLINGLMAKGLTQIAMGKHEEAEDSFRRVQHIMHRQDGVYAAEQIPVIDWLTKTSLKRGSLTAADREQRFSLRVSEKVYGAESVELLPVLSRLGAYFASRGSTISVLAEMDLRLQRDMLFKSSVDSYLRAVAIIEQNFGENDLRLVQPLRGLANARMLQITNRKYAEEALVRSLSIVEANPDSDLTDRAQALVDLGDLYTITSDQRASAIYLRAWDLLQASAESQSLANAFFETPLRLFPRETPILYLNRRPDATERGEPLFVELGYNVNTMGKVTGVKVLEKNVPNEQVRLLRHNLKSARYRPRILDAEIQDTEGLSLYQSYEIYNRFDPLADVDQASGEGLEGELGEETTDETEPGESGTSDGPVAAET